MKQLPSDQRHRPLSVVHHEKSFVVIDKLPFLVPTEPLVAARINWLEREGENSFLKYSLPEAIITLKQGLGRLIRSRQDRGILAATTARPLAQAILALEDGYPD